MTGNTEIGELMLVDSGHHLKACEKGVLSERAQWTHVTTTKAMAEL